MTDEKTLLEVISLYNSHGWQLRRALLSDELWSGLGSNAAEPIETMFVPSDLNALWFSRPRGKQITWEIRSLDEPFALVRVVDETAGSEEVDEILCEAEEKLRTRRRTLTARG
jgi:hypothetical protein